MWTPLQVCKNVENSCFNTYWCQKTKMWPMRLRLLHKIKPKNTHQTKPRGPWRSQRMSQLWKEVHFSLCLEDSHWPTFSGKQVQVWNLWHCFSRHTDEAEPRENPRWRERFSVQPVRQAVPAEDRSYHSHEETQWGKNIIIWKTFTFFSQRCSGARPRVFWVRQGVRRALRCEAVQAQQKLTLLWIQINMIM